MTATARNVPIKRQLMAITMTATAAALTLAGAGLVISDIFLFRNMIARDNAALARIVADNTTAALSFGENATARDTLASLRTRPHLLAACLFDDRGLIFATYARAGEQASCPPADGGDGQRFTNVSLITRRDVMLNNQRIGTLVLIYDLGEISERIGILGVTVAIVVLLASIVAYLLSNRLQRMVAEPIAQLSHAARVVSETRNYDIRAPQVASLELDQLATDLNEMLDRIRSQDRELRMALTQNQEVRESLRTTLASIGDAVISTDSRGSVVFANAVALNMIGLPEQSVTGRHLDEVLRIVNEATHEPVASPLRKVLDDRQIVVVANHTLLLSHSGDEIPVDDSGAPILDKHGAIQGAVLVFRDVRERRRTERELAESAERLQLAIQAGRMGVWQWNAANQTFRGSATLAGILGREEKEFEIGFEDYLEYVHAGHRAGVRASLEAMLDEAADHTKEYRVARPDGLHRWIHTRGRVIRDETGKVVSVIGIAMDITERRELEEALRHAKEFDDAVMNNMGEGLYTVDSQGLVTFMNPAAEQMLGWTLAELRGKRMHDMTHYKHRDGSPFPAEDCAGFQVLRKGVTLNAHEDAFIRKDGSFFDVIYSSSPLQDGDQVTGLVVVFRDITERKRADEAIRAAAAELSLSNQELLRSNADLERFAFVASHDLQEPLRMITTYAQLLVREFGPGHDPKSDIYVKYISDGTSRMRDLLADLRTYTELRGDPQDAPQPIDLEQLLETVKLDLQVAIGEAQASITNDPLPAIVAHPPHIVSLFQNLVGNALKYRGEQPAQIHVGVEQAEGETRFVVRDRGIGIAPDYHEQIFGAFKRLHGRQVPGTGIGLAICRRIVERYGGRIWVESKAGEGAAFYFTLPLARKS